MSIAKAVLDMVTESKEMSHKIKNYSDEEIQTLYVSAFQFYQQGNYTKALDLFLQLTTNCPYEPNFWKGLASTYQMQSLYDEALHAWALYALLEPQDPYAHYHAAECLFAKSDKKESSIALNKALELCKKDHEALINKIKLFKEFF